MTERAPVEHDLKTWPEFFIEVVSGRKTFEVRFNDRDYQVGDVLKLREYSPTLGTFSGEVTRQRVSYVMSGRFGVDPEYVIMGLQPIDPVLDCISSRRAHGERSAQQKTEE